MPTNYLETIKMMASVGLGWSVLPVSMVDDSLTVLSVPHSVSRILGGVGLKGRSLSPQAQALLDIAADLQYNPLNPTATPINARAAASGPAR